MGAPPTAPPIRYQLVRPITWAGTEVRELTIQRPTAAQLWTFPVPTGGKSIEFGAFFGILAKCSGLPDDAIRLLDIEDALALTNILGELLGSSRATGI